MITLVSGSRGIIDSALVFNFLYSLPWTVTRVVHGAARGVDTLAGVWAASRGIPVDAYPADWSMGRGAGMVRNRLMLGLAEAVAVCWDGVSPGTAHTLRLALDLGKPTYCYLLGAKRAGRLI